MSNKCFIFLKSQFKSYKECLVILMLSFFMFTTSTACLANESSLSVHQNNKIIGQVYGLPYRYLNDHASPDLCSHHRRLAYKYAISSISLAAGAGAFCLVGAIVMMAGMNPVTLAIGGSLCVAGIGIAISSAAMVGMWYYHQHKYDKCCNDLKASDDFGYPRDEMLSGSMCDQCMENANMMRNECGE